MNPSAQAELSEQAVVPHVDFSGLLRAIAMLENGQLHHEAILSLLRHEMGAVVQQADALSAFTQETRIELRQARETKERTLLIQEDNDRKLQESNDTFVAQMIAEHEVVVQSLRRERDAAIDRVRELSRGLSRIGSVSSPNLRRSSIPNLTATSPADDEATALRARIDELLLERERSLKLLRQLAEQRDQAESRMQMVLSSIAPEADIPQSSNRSITHQATTNATVQNLHVTDDSLAALPAAVPRDRAERRPPPTPMNGAADELPPGTQRTVGITSSPLRADSLPKATDSALDWDLSIPTKHALEPNPEVPAGNADDADMDEEAISSPAVSEAILPLLRKKNPTGDGAGSYTVSAGELPEEEVVVLRSRPSHPRPIR